MKLHSETIFTIVDGELDYQNKKWGDLYNDENWSIGDWLIFIERYVERAKNVLGHPCPSLCEIRKIAALAVKCLMCYGAPTRAEEEEMKRLSGRDSE